MRPSSTSFASVIFGDLAPYGRNRTGSRRPGVSSTMTSQPVRSRASGCCGPRGDDPALHVVGRGGSTIETVVAAAWLAASRPMPVEMMLRTRRSDSRFASSSTRRIIFAMSWRTSSSVSLSSCSRACDSGSCRDARSSSRDGGVLRRLQLVLQRPACTSRSLMPCSRRVSSAPFWSKSARRVRWRAPRPAPLRAAQLEPAPRSPGARGAAAPWPGAPPPCGAASASRCASSSSDSAFSGVGLGPTRRVNLLLQEESDRSAYEKRGHTRPQPRLGRPRNHLFSPHRRRHVSSVSVAGAGHRWEITLSEAFANGMRTVKNRV